MDTGPREVAESYWRAECERNIDAVMAHFLPDAEFWSPDQRFAGHAEIRTYYEASAARFPGLEVSIVRDVVVGSVGALEWVARLTDRQGRSFDARGVNVVQVKDGRFAWAHSYFDASVLNQPDAREVNRDA